MGGVCILCSPTPTCCATQLTVGTKPGPCGMWVALPLACVPSAAAPHGQTRIAVKRSRTQISCPVPERSPTSTTSSRRPTGDTHGDTAIHASTQ
eukprot:6367916-Prymnesium_polylepis.1